MAGKIITIDWEAIAELPSDEFYYKLLNKQQVAVLLALCEYQYWETRWDNLAASKHELARFMGDIEYRLMKSEEISMATEDDIANGMYKAFNWLALQIASGSYANLKLSTDADGVVSPVLPDGDTSDVELPDDDTDTPDINETLAAQYGGFYEQDRAIELYLDKIDGYYGVDATPDTSQIATEAFITAYFAVDETALDVAMTAYYDYRVTPLAALGFNSSDAIRQYVFCRGGGARAYSQWLIDSSGYSAAKINVMNLLIGALAPEFWVSYYERGITKPSTLYVGAGCVKVRPQTYTGLLFATPRTTEIMKANHRMKMRQKGYALDVDGDTQDSFWYRTAAGVLTRTNWTYSQSGQAAPTDLQVPYNASHEYEYTIDLLGNTLGMTVTPNKNAGMNSAGLTYPVPFELYTEDLGEYTV